MTQAVSLPVDKVLSRHLDSLSNQLIEAAEEGDIARLTRVDHALRNAVIAWVGSDCFAGVGSEQRVGQLRAALKSVATACARVRLAPNRGDVHNPNTRGNLVYLKFNRTNHNERD